jgi:hypothetical protein
LLRGIISPVQTYCVSETARDNVTSRGCDQQDCPSEPHFHDNKADFTQHHSDSSSYESGRNSKCSSAPNHECKASRKPLTAQTLHEHDFQQATYSQLFNLDGTNQRVYATCLDAAFVAPIDDPAGGLQENGIGTLKNMSLEYPLQHTLRYRNQAQNRQHSISSTYVEHGLNTTTYQASGRWSRSSHEGDITGPPGYDDDNIEPQYWDTDHVREFTVWDNDLAGVGAHFDGSTYQEYATSDDIVFDQYSA